MPFATGKASFVLVGARVSIRGGGATSTGAGIGFCHDFKATGIWRFANGFANVDSGLPVPSRPPEPVNAETSGMARVEEGMPALRSAIFVVNLANMLKISGCNGSEGLYDWICFVLSCVTGSSQTETQRLWQGFSETFKLGLEKRS